MDLNKTIKELEAKYQNELRNSDGSGGPSTHFQVTRDMVQIELMILTKNIAKKADKSSKILIGLTVVLAILTVILIIMTYYLIPS